MNHLEIRIIIVVICRPKEIEKPKDQALVPKNGFHTFWLFSVQICKGTNLCTSQRQWLSITEDYIIYY